MIQAGTRVRWERLGLPPALGTVTDTTTDAIGRKFHKVTDDQANRYVFHEEALTEAD